MIPPCESFFSKWMPISPQELEVKVTKFVSSKQSRSGYEPKTFGVEVGVSNDLSYGSG